MREILHQMREILMIKIEMGGTKRTIELTFVTFDIHYMPLWPRSMTML